MTVVASLSFFGNLFTVDCFSQDPRTGGLAHAPGSAKQEGMCQVTGFYGILQGGGNMFLYYSRIKSLGTIFSG